jgi:hypothetical protein
VGAVHFDDNGNQPGSGEDIRATLLEIEQHSGIFINNIQTATAGKSIQYVPDANPAHICKTPQLPN